MPPAQEPKPCAGAQMMPHPQQFVVSLGKPALSY
jgi:hypothetical protein